MASCVGCKWMYGQGEGYSNYTWMNTSIICALKRNPNLPADEPYDWTRTGTDNWPATRDSRCERYAEGPWIELDPNGEDKVESQTTDAEVIAAINAYRE